MSPFSSARTGGTASVVFGAALMGGLVLLGAPVARAQAQSTPSTSPTPPGITSPKVSISTGPLRRTPPQRGALWESRRLSTTVDGKAADLEVIHLRGLEGIEAADIPESAKAFLLTHAKTLPEDEVAHYVLNKKQLEEWAQAHPMPETLKQTKEKHRKRGCKSISMKCAKKGVEHVSKEVSKQAEALRHEARREWEDVSREVGRGLKMAEGALRKCFADHPIKSGPIRIPPQHIPMAIEVAGAPVKDKHGKVVGKANIRLPARLTDATVEVSAFMIPCAFPAAAAGPMALPLWIRPRSVSFEGVLTVDSTLDLELNANGALHDSIELMRSQANLGPPIVIFIHAVPVELDLGLEFEARVDYKTSGALQATLCDVRQRKVRLDFECDGKGCRSKSEEMEVKIKPIHDLQLTAQGQASIRPSVFTALTFDVNFGALSARVGPEFYVSAEVQGGARASSSGTRGPGSGVSVAGLSAGLYGGVDIRHFVNFLRPEFAGGKSAGQLAKGINPWIRKPLLESISVRSPSAAAQASKPGLASARCAK
jgi:hypothetical protein